ncbi:helix-turn-helix domain-containing protein [Halovivax cerinus]|uniref:Helix-turn-helix domain-containing protein n=1 Tax=Halovivax cerinus TaxID=1487865 RepID=A0ABD5NN27_9EURY|nr:helix-turn-helix domain-containing protein [Halovivax cerinus]
MSDDGIKGALAEKMAGEVVLSSDPGATIRKWRTDFGISQTALADELDVSASVVSDYESGRRENPGIGVVGRIVSGLLAIDEHRGGERIRQYGNVLSAGFESDVVYDLREYATTRSLGELHDAVDATEVSSGSSDRISGHTVIDSIEAITRLSSDEFVRLYGQSTNRALVFTGVTRGESPLVALRVVTQTPNAVVLHGIDESELWDHAADLARIDGYSLAVSTAPLESMLETLAAME